MMFPTRAEAGRQLGRYLQARGCTADWVLGLPRGGVIVAAEVARWLQRPLDVLIVRKIGHPWQREFAVGALAEPDVLVMEGGIVSAEAGLHRRLQDIVREEQQRLQQYRDRFHPGGLPDLRHRTVLLVDDGVATGATTRAAVLGARKLGAARVLVATPVASDTAVERLRQVADEVVALHVDPGFEAVGCYYEVFDQTSDEEVLAALRPHRAPGG